MLGELASYMLLTIKIASEAGRTRVRWFPWTHSRASACAPRRSPDGLRRCQAASPPSGQRIEKTVLPVAPRTIAGWSTAARGVSPGGYVQ